VHSRIGQYVRPAGRIHDNSWNVSPIVVKFSTQNFLINISVEFEDENDWSRNGLVIAQKCHYFLCFSIQTLTYPDFHKHFSVIIKITTTTIIYRAIENFMGYKMVYKTLRKNWPIRLNGS
jgi:hypothetical protein